MIFNRERGIRRESPKQDVLALEPSAFCQVKYDTKHPAVRMFYVCLGDRTLAKGISPTRVWGVALKVLQQERERT